MQTKNCLNLEIENNKDNFFISDSIKNIVDFEFFLLDQFKKKHKNIVKSVKTKLALDDTLIKELEGALDQFVDFLLNTNICL